MVQPSVECNVRMVLQAVMGSLVKQYMGRKLGRPPEAIYHVAIMPCYDKKLEASREDFVTAGGLCKARTPMRSLHTSQPRTAPPCCLLANLASPLQPFCRAAVLPAMGSQQRPPPHHPQHCTDLRSQAARVTPALKLTAC